MYNFNQKLKGLDGTEILDENKEPISIGKMLGNQIAFTGKGDALKLFNWAQKMYSGEEVDLDESDVAKLKELINMNENMTVLAKGQLLEILK